jgi:threonine/homoserine/homoserine lactone efflux protein
VPSGTSLLGFTAGTLVLLLIPGPAVLYIVARSLDHGRRAGLISVLGLSVGGLVHVTAATAGLSAILLASATAFALVKTLGAAYLIYLGIRTIVAQGPADQMKKPSPRSSGRIFRDGVLVSVLSPKTALFFLAFLPQFVEPGRGPIPQQVLLLGIVFVSMALVTDSAYALLAGSLRQRLGEQLMQKPLLRYVRGSLYLGLGVSTALTGRRH